MTQIKDGGPAFPQLEVISCERDGHGDLIEPFTSVVGGITLHDWYAGQALIGLLSGQYAGSSKYNFSEVPTEAHSIADAMIAAREGRQDD